MKSTKKIFTWILVIAMVVTTINLPQGRRKTKAAIYPEVCQLPNGNSYVTVDQLKNPNRFTLSSSNGRGVAQKVYFGKQLEGDDQLQEWYIAGYDSETDGLVLMCNPEMPIGESVFQTSTSVITSRIKGIYEDNKIVTAVYANHYGCSVLRQYLSYLTLDEYYPEEGEEDPGVFTYEEKQKMKKSRITTKDMYGDNGNYTLYDKLYAPHYDYCYNLTNTNPVSPSYGTVLYYRSGIQVGTNNMIAISTSNYPTLNSPFNKPGTYYWLREGDDRGDAYIVGGYHSGEEGARILTGRSLTTSTPVVPAFALDLVPVLFASSAMPGQANSEMTDALTIRYDASSRIQSTLVTDKDTIRIKKSAADEGDVYLYVVGNDGEGDWIYSVQITDNMTITDSTIKRAKRLEGIDLSKCKIWLETYNAEENLTYAKETVVEEEHSFAVMEMNEDTLLHEATCHSPAEYYYSCECGAIGTETFTYGDPIDHADTDRNGRCDFCDTVLYVLPELTYSHTLTLQSNLSINYYVAATDIENFDVITLHVEKDSYDKNGNKTVITSVLDGEIVDAGYGREYKFRYTGIASYEVGNEVRAYIVAEKGGTTYTFNSDTYSVATYCYNQLNKSTTTEKLKTLIVDLLNYASFSQQQFGIRTNMLVNSDLTEEMRAYASSECAELKSNSNSISLEGAAAEISGKTLVLGNSVELKVYMKLPEALDKSKVTLRLQYTNINEKDVEISIPFDEFSYTASSKEYSARYDGILAPEFRNIISLVICDDGNPISDTHEYSIETYAYNRINSETSTDLMKSLVMAMMMYCDSAATYFGKSTPPSSTSPITDEIKNAEVGSVITFGKYEQDNIISNGKEPIEWIVLEKQGSKLLVVSKYILDCQQFSSSTGSLALWQSSTIRTWLNKSFKNTAFSIYEQYYIPTMKVEKSYNSSIPTSRGSAETYDQIYLLSIFEAEKYFKTKAERKGVATAYAIANGCYTPEEGYGTYWWLRTAGSIKEVRRDGQIVDNLFLITYINTVGDVSKTGMDPTWGVSGVRPAMWIDLEP